MLTQSKIDDHAARLKKIRLYLGMTRKEFGEKINISQYTIRSWESGSKNFSAKSVSRVIENLKKINFLCTFEWLMNGVGKSPISLHEEKNKLLNNKIKLSSITDNILKEVILFKELNNQVSVVCVTDDRFYPFASAGDYVGLMPLSSENIDNHIKDIVFYISNDETHCFGLLDKMKDCYIINDFLKGETKSLHLSDCNETMYLLVWYRKFI